jgi:glycosyltransferase involved in cell wall biosynthesis
MIRGDIYLHPSLTEAFGTVIVEAASCGLYVVATAVGGVPEVLPPHMTIFAKPEEDGNPNYSKLMMRFNICDNQGDINSSSKSS